MNAGYIILIAGLGVGLWAWYTDYRIKALEAKLALLTEKAKDDEIEKKIHAMPDAKLDGELSKFLVGPPNKPS